MLCFRERDNYKRRDLSKTHRAPAGLCETKTDYGANKSKNKTSTSNAAIHQQRTTRLSETKHDVDWRSTIFYDVVPKPHVLASACHISWRSNCRAHARHVFPLYEIQFILSINYTNFCNDSKRWYVTCIGATLLEHDSEDHNWWWA